MICDDHAEHRQTVERACAAYVASRPELQVQTESYESPLLLLERLERTGGCEIALLDICMPGISGIEVAREIRKRKDRTEILFLTTSADFAVEAFSLQAVHYLLKPFSDEAFREAMDLAVSRFERAPVRKLLINGEGGAVNAVDVSDILYVESFRNTRGVFTEAVCFFETKRTLAALLKELGEASPGQFVSPYRGYVVNLSAVRSLSPDGIVLRNGVSVPIKPGSFRKLKEAYFQWSFGSEVR